ncbi:hypothetical protein AcW1_000664 [Taiwanofungus camphoratus]|nr:hypothetical protein AcW2_000837 [Antrodia cinnamomea]KAI0936415.1 hypothetical protein AcV5_004562 [Antrodia cinnamomea]KAI0961632.1 hypothetical protein AcV7_000683 [Antrodia cinnamomea]KAI0963645.1 hypothetical protein AcW1_000664 [Antrodia cinnamomea]
MQTARLLVAPRRLDPDGSDVDYAMATANEPSTYFLPLAEPIALVSDSHRVDHLPFEEQADHDIYRGEQQAPPRSPSLESVTTSSSSSSSASSAFRGRLGAISAVVEHAIAKWARAWASSSSLTTSSSSSDLSIVTMTRSQSARKRRRRLRLADLHNQRSEREIAARIRAREESRYIPRAFDLYVPYPLDLGVTPTTTVTGSDGQRRHVLHTDSLPLLITHLSAALKDLGKKRARSDAALPDMLPSLPLHHDYMIPEELPITQGTSALPDTQVRQRGKKGKGKASSGAAAPQASTTLPLRNEHDRDEKAWWVDVSSPTWEDMRAIGKLLHLHPLTLEDILQQDPHEKLELFPRLGYYFIVFRAVESQKTRERVRSLHGARDGSTSLPDEGIVGEVNVYMVVFREGICSFHFADVGEHVDRVRNRILKLGQSVNMSSDWIAHGIMDSIVDSFFPFLKEIEKEVDEIEKLVVSDYNTSTETEQSSADMQMAQRPEEIVACDEPQDDKRSTLTLTEKTEEFPKAVVRKIQFSLPASFPLFFRRLRRSLGHWRAHFQVVFRRSPVQATASTVYRMARARRLVTSLARFLAHKSEVVAQLQKRLLTTGEWGLGHGNDHDQDVYIYMGDVQGIVVYYAIA